MCSFIACGEISSETLTAACSSLVMESGKLVLGGTGILRSSAPAYSISPPSSPQATSRMPASEDMLMPSMTSPTVPRLRMKPRLTIKTDRASLGPVSGSLDSQSNHIAKFKNRRAHSIATSKAPDPRAGLPTSPTSKPHLTSNLSVANMRSSFEEMRHQHIPLLKRAFSEPCFHSWDYGYTNDVFEAEYDISPATTERAAWDEVILNGTRSRTPTTSDEDLPLAEKKAQQDIIFRTNDSGKSLVVAGTLAKLVHYLASEELPDTNYIKMFIFTFHRFMSSTDLLTKLIAHFKNPATIKDPPTDPAQKDHILRLIKSRIINVLKLWLIVSPNDLHYGDAAGIFTSFLLDLQQSTQEEKAMANSLNSAIMTDPRVLFSLSTSIGTASPPVSPTAALAMKKIGILPRPKTPITKVDQFLDVPPKELARQLTLIDQEMMQSINPRDLTEKSRDKTKISPLVEISKRFDQVSGWVTSEVVLTPHHKQRVLVVTNFVYLIEELIKLNNFHSAMSVYLGLGATPCTRLKETWKSLSRKISDKWQSLEQFMSPSFNFKKLRSAIAYARRPIIPPLTVLVKDLTFMEENAEHYAADPRLINFEKISLIGQLLVDIHECSVTNYDLEVVPAIRTYLTKLFVLSDEKLELASKSAMRAATKLSSQSDPRTVLTDLAVEASPRHRIKRRSTIITRLFSPEERKLGFS